MLVALKKFLFNTSIVIIGTLCGPQIRRLFRLQAAADC